MRTGELEHPYPPTKIMWSPDKSQNSTDLLATTGGSGVDVCWLLLLLLVVSMLVLVVAVVMVMLCGGGVAVLLLLLLQLLIPSCWCCCAGVAALVLLWLMTAPQPPPVVPLLGFCFGRGDSDSTRTDGRGLPEIVERRRARTRRREAALSPQQRENLSSTWRYCGCHPKPLATCVTSIELARTDAASLPSATKAVTPASRKVGSVVVVISNLCQLTSPRSN